MSSVYNVNIRSRCVPFSNMPCRVLKNTLPVTFSSGLSFKRAGTGAAVGHLGGWWIKQAAGGSEFHWSLPLLHLFYSAFSSPTFFKLARNMESSTEISISTITNQYQHQHQQPLEKEAALVFEDVLVVFSVWKCWCWLTVCDGAYERWRPPAQ